MILKEIEILTQEAKDEPIGISFLDQRRESMRNPQGYVAVYYNFFHRLIQVYKPDIVVELGTWQGTSAACFAAGNPDTTVITVDHHTDPGDDFNKALTLDACKEFSNIKYCQGWTCNQLYEEEKDRHSIPGENAFSKVIEELNGREIDILFIDSWHRYDQAIKDWKAYRPLLRNGALVICDDICAGSPGGGIEKMDAFWDEIHYDKFLANNLHSGYPMGFLIYDLG